jgi:ubiquinol-cytochrome c reductase cytochrome b subunit
LTQENQPSALPPNSENIRRKSGGPTRLWRWIDRRTGADELLHKSLDEPVPGGARFAYVFGSALLFLIVSQVVTGLCLALYYVPSPLSAHVTLAYIIKDVAGGAFLRSLHSYGSSAMIVVLVLHFLQTFLYGSYKGRRELLWLSGCVLSLLILGMAFTGYLLRWDLKAYFAGSVGTSLAGDVPLIGGWLLRLLRGGPTMGALTLSRFYVLHVFLLPATIFLFIAIHIFLFRKAGAAGPIAEDPMHPHLPAETFYPKQVIMDMLFVLVVMGILGTLAHFVPEKLGPVADPSNSNYLPRPEWYYLPFFEWLKFWDGAKTVIGVIVIPGILIGLVFLLPFLDRSLERRPWRRPIPVGSVLIVLIGVIGLGMQSRLDDSRDPTTASQIAQQNLAEDQYFHAPFQPYSASSISGGTAPVALSGAAAQGRTIFDSNRCSGCHGVGGIGGVGPALTHISDKFPPDQLTELLKEPNAKMKAGGMVPLTLNAADMSALVSYTSSLGGTSASSSTLTAATPMAEGPPRSLRAETKLVAPPSVTSKEPTATLESSASTGNKNPGTGSGGKIYQSDGCAACHGEGGTGTQRGPALVDVGKKLSAVQVTDLLHNPTAKMKAGGMPAVTGGDEEIRSLVAYLRSLQSTGTAHEQTANASGVAPPIRAQGALPPPTPATPASAPAGPPSQPQTGAVNSAAAGQPANPSDQGGEAIYNSQGCAGCHGPGGVGTSSAPALSNFSKATTPAALTSLLEDPNHKMKAGGMSATNLPANEMSALVAYLQDLGTPATAPPATKLPSPAGSATTVPAPASNQAAPVASQPPLNQLESKGKVIFGAHGCGDCHGMDGVGGTAAAPALANTGKTFSPEQLTTMLQHPTVPMQKGGMPPVSLSDGEMKALVAYVSSISVPKNSSRP